MDAGIASDGTANSFFKAAHLVKTRHAHQVTAAALWVLLHEAYDSYAALAEVEVVQNFEEWRQHQSLKSPHFQFCSLVLVLQLDIFNFIHAERAGEFKAYVGALYTLLPWFFALDHQNYAQWLSGHICDLLTLEEKHPQIFKEFKEGNFVAYKTANKFSAIALDHCHEQNKKLITGTSGCAIGLTENPNALRRWMIGGPEVVRLLLEFEDCKTSPSITEHHDSHKSIQ